MQCTTLTLSEMRDRIERSNRDSAQNRNCYIVQEQASISEIYEQAACDCSENCTCREFGCSAHWRLKSDVTFREFQNAFLRMFVDNHQHAKVIQTVTNGDDAVGRARGASEILTNVRRDWMKLSESAHLHGKCLFCDDWLDPFWKHRFSVYEGSVYWAKQWAALLPDTAIPYDTQSRLAIQEFTGESAADYTDVLTGLRKCFLEAMRRDNVSLDDFRRLDDPNESGVAFHWKRIRLPRPGFDYPNEYEPKTRPISRVIDKCFYSP